MKARNTLIFIVSVIFTLGFISLVFPNDGVVIMGRRMFFPKPQDIFVHEAKQSVRERMKEIEESLKMKLYEDSLSSAKLAAHNDSVIFYAHYFARNPARIYFPDNNTSFLDSFFYQIENTSDNELIHILHYGDSQIESDRITGLLRQKLQEQFGGSGPGLIPLVQPIPSLTVGQTASENIQRYTISGNFQNKSGHSRYGIMGQVAEINDYGSLSVYMRKNPGNFENVKTFNKIRLFLSNNSPGFEAVLKIGKSEIKRTVEEESVRMRILTWTFPTSISSFSMQFTGSAEVTALSLDGKSGITVDNIPLRGSSGTFFTSIDASSIAPAMRDLNVKLILLEFGGNTVPAIKGQKSLENYKKGMARQIVWLQKIHPQAKIILIGPADMSTKTNGKLQSYPYLKETIDMLKEAALENGAAYWNMYEVMGGHNSMLEWVKTSPKLAAADYVHFTNKGADKIGNLFAESFLLYYDYYQFRKNKK